MFHCGRFQFALDRPLIMGIVNVTPDSFSDGGLCLDPAAAIEHGRRLVAEGADILDIGGESTRPGAQPVPLEEEIERVIPVVEGLRDVGVALSVDTMKPEVMRAALAAGADMINDVNALRAPGAWAAVRDGHCGLCLMHMQGTPRTMQQAPYYDDVVAEVHTFLQQRIMEAQAQGIARERLLIDPGFGFGKSLEHNIALFKHIAVLAETAPVLVGVSRKSMLGAITGRPVHERLVASVVAAVLAAQAGAAVLRVHDVAATRDALRLLQALGGKTG
ncbi:MAG: dihydropteroate synthase [Burkholderiales bacterium]|nr:dihydropteroate synthase [Burkholderiales bacterium]